LTRYFNSWVEPSNKVLEEKIDKLSKSYHLDQMDHSCFDSSQSVKTFSFNEDDSIQDDFVQFDRSQDISKEEDKPIEQEQEIFSNEEIVSNATEDEEIKSFGSEDRKSGSGDFESIQIVRKKQMNKFPYYLILQMELHHKTLRDYLMEKRKFDGKKKRKFDISISLWIESFT